MNAGQPDLRTIILKSPTLNVVGEVRTKPEKLIARLLQRPKDFTWDELKRFLKTMGYVERKSGKTGGSRRRFVHPVAPAITLHKPHPGRIVKAYVLNDILEFLRRERMI